MQNLKVSSPEEALALVKQNPNALQIVPQEFITAEMCLIAVTYCGSLLLCVPEALKTPEICRAAVKETGLALECVPDELKTLALCLNAVQNIGIAIEYVPEKLKTLELCLAAARNAWSGNVFTYIPDELKTQVKQIRLEKSMNKPSFIPGTDSENKTGSIYLRGTP